MHPQELQCGTVFNRNMLQEFFWQQLGNMYLNKLWFQQESATAVQPDKNVYLQKRLIPRRSEIN